MNEATVHHRHSGHVPRRNRHPRTGMLLTEVTHCGSRGLLDQFEASSGQVGVAGLKMPPSWSLLRDSLSVRASTQWDALATVRVR